MLIALITDTHLGDKTPASLGIDPKKNLQTVLDSINDRNPDLLVFAGDITEKEHYQWFFEKLASVCPDYKAVLGNHDDHTEAAKYFTHPSASDEELYYSYEDTGYKYIFMDSSSAHISDAQYAWLEKETAIEKKIIVFIHHPVVGIGSAMDRIYPLHGRDRINRLLQECQNPVTIFCGHYHMPDTRTDGNITQHITPAVSFQVDKEAGQLELNADSFGYRLINIGETITTQLYINRGNGFIEEA